MAIYHTDGTVTHVGLCIGYHTWYNSSMDVTSYYVHAYNPETGAIDSIYVNDDFSGRDSQSTYTIDATEEVKAIVEAQEAFKRETARQLDELRAIMTPAKGKRLEVIKGRKVAKGTAGEFIWIGNGTYGVRVGIKDNAGNVHWTSADNVQVV